MNCCCNRFPFIGVVALAVVAGTIAYAQATKDGKPGAKPTAGATISSKAPAAAAGDQTPPLPPGWTEADMQACMQAGVPGEMHKHLTDNIGVWTGKTTMWMAPGMEPTKSECTSTVTPMMDGRFTKCEIAGDMPGMGPFSGFGIYGYDNVSKTFQATWIDNCGTGMMNGTGELSSDGKTMTWTFTANCPITKKPTTFREVDRSTGKDTMTFEMHGIDPKSGKEFKMMECAYTRKPGSATAVVPN